MPGKIKKSVLTLPPLRVYLKHKQLKHENLILEQNNQGLKEAVERLENRNDEWAAEVRELRGEGRPHEVLWPVKPEDIINAAWYQKQPVTKSFPSKPPYVLNWVVPPMGQGSGGHADIFRTINYLEVKGYLCRVYSYDALNASSLDTIKKNLQYYSPIKAELFYNAKMMKDCDAIIATNWFTAYPVYNYAGSAKKYYYVQDFEPYFEPVGTYSALAENTYKFGLRGLTLGSWLSKKLSEEYGMQCDPFELAVNHQEYTLTNKKPRKKVLFYARPVTPRRGFELGVLTLELFHKQHPEYEIHFLGWDTSRFKFAFPYVDHGILTVEQLNDLYNECVAGLVLSFTNMSLLPLEMLASGCVPVINDAEHTRMVSYHEQLVYAEPSPQALADALHDVVKVSDEVNVARAANLAKKTLGLKWDDSNAKIDSIFKKELCL